jgi:signal transduction histidine kinase
MTLRCKTLLIIGFTLVGLIAASYLAASYIVLRRFSALEMQQMEMRATRTHNMIDNELRQLESITRYQAEREKTYRFATEGHGDYVEEYLGFATYENLNVDLIALTRVDGKIVFARSFDLVTRHETPLAQKVTSLLTRDSGLILGPDAVHGKSGILQAGSTMLLFAAQPIRADAGAQQNGGTLLVARELDDHTLQRLSQLVQLKLDISGVVGDLDEDFAAAWSELRHGSARPYFAALDDATYAGYLPLLDQTRQPVALLRVTSDRAVYGQARAATTYLLVTLLVVGVVFIAITLLSLERLVLARLARLSSEVNHIGMGSDISARVTELGRDELSALARNINRLLQNLGSQIDLEQAVANAQSAAQAKSTFLANMSHELRTPLNAIIGYSELVQDTAADHHLSGVIPDLQKIVEAARHLQSIIANVLDISKIEAGKMELELASLDLKDNIAAVRDIVAVKAAEKNLQLIVSVAPNVPNHVVGDAARLRQILVNLLNNAVKFTERGGVELSVDAKLLSPGEQSSGPWEIQFAVRDTGIGIPAQRFDRLFKSFSQVDPSSSRKYGGTGLGLAISKQLCEMMGGRMWAESVEGMGTTFYFTIRAPEAEA